MLIPAWSTEPALSWDRSSCRRLVQPALRAVAQQMIRQHHRHHRFAHRNGADADAGVEAAGGDDVDLFAGGVDALARLIDGGGRLDGEAHQYVLPGRDAAEDAARHVGQELELAVLDAHLVGVLFASQRRGGEAGADLDALDRVDAHHGRGEVGIELAVERRAEPDRHAGGRHLDHRADRGTGLARAVQQRFPLRHHFRVRAPEAVALGLGPVPAGARGADAADLDQGAADLHRLVHQVRQHLARDRARRDARGGLARGGTPAAAIVAVAVILGPVGEVGVAGTELVLDLAVVLAALILVLDYERDRRAGGLALEHAGQDLDLVILAPLGDETRLPGLALVEPGLDVGLGELDARWRAIDHAT